MAQKILSILLLCLFISSSLFAQTPDPYFQPENIKSIMGRVFAYQVAHPIVKDNWVWERAAFYTGVMAAYQATGEEKYLRQAIAWSEANGWKPGPQLRLADDHCCGQTYCEIYFLKKDPRMIAELARAFDAIMADPQPGRVDWYWCDALFMAPPAWARLAQAKGEPKYLDFANQMWWDTTDFLYDRQEHLFYRDNNYKPDPNGRQRFSKNGKKIFWSRGNGWVIAGTVRVLQYLPADYPDRPRYVKLLQEMAQSLAKVQGPDGLWRMSLLDAAENPTPETSGSGFNCYALAWGINNGLLDREQYLGVVEKAWRGLAGSVNAEGRLGYVQRPGAAPGQLKPEDTHEYGAGAFLLAGSEIFKLFSSPERKTAP